MKLAANIKRFLGQLHKGTSKPGFMRYDRDKDIYDRRPTSWHGGAFKRGWRDAEWYLRRKRRPYTPATLRWLTWCDLGYRFVRWMKAEGKDPGDRGEAYEQFKRLLRTRQRKAETKPEVSPIGLSSKVTALSKEPNLEYLFKTKRQIKLAKKAEAGLLGFYEDWLRKKQRKLKALRFGRLRCDGFEPKYKNLIEAKSSVKREDIRMAVGELLDYSYLAKKKYRVVHNAILVPERPDPEVEKWLRELGIGVIWKDNQNFCDNANGQFGGHRHSGLSQSAES